MSSTKDSNVPQTPVVTTGPVNLECSEECSSTDEEIENCFFCFYEQCDFVIPESKVLICAYCARKSISLTGVFRLNEIDSFPRKQGKCVVCEFKRREDRDELKIEVPVCDLNFHKNG